MLDDFIFEQQIATRTLINSVKNDKVSHAYIVETNGYNKSFEFIISFVKYLFCPNACIKRNDEHCLNCNLCNSIDKNEFVELKIIEADGQWIKKNQLDKLQYDFSKKSVIGDKKVYIIKNAEKLNISSSNSLLKFLEEPEDGIIAILMVDNIYQLLSTVVSRCQIISLKNKKSTISSSSLQKISDVFDDKLFEVDDNVSDSEKLFKIQKILEFVLYYEENHENTIIYMNKLWHENFKERTDIYNAFTIMLLFYKDVLNNKLNRKLEFFDDYIEYIVKIEEKNTSNSLISKINVLMNLREKIKFNVNNNMIMDKLIIELERCDYSD